MSNDDPGVILYPKFNLVKIGKNSVTCYTGDPSDTIVYKFDNPDIIPALKLQEIMKNKITNSHTHINKDEKDCVQCMMQKEFLSLLKESLS